MTRDVPELREFLTRADHAPVSGWEAEPNELNCSRELIALLAQVARPISGAARVFVGGCPVVLHPSGVPIAAAAGTDWLVVRERGMFVELDPAQPDQSLVRGLDVLRARVAAAYREVEESAWR